MDSIVDYADDLGECYTNFDHDKHALENELVEANGDAYAQHSAYDFCGYIYYKNGVFYEEIWQYNSKVNLMRNNNMEALIFEACDNYGWN